MAAIAVLALAACGGGGGGLTPSAGTPGGGSTNPTQSSSAKGTMAITIPSAAALSTRAHRDYISPSTKSAVVSLVTNNKPTQIAEANLTPTSANCSSASGGLQCTIAFIAPPGSDTLQLALYDATGGTGKLLATAEVSVTLTASAVTSVPVSLDGVPSAATVVLGASTLPVGTAGSVSLIVQATDADGNIIVGPGSFTAPIALTITGDTHSTLSLSNASITAPGQATTLSYNGGSNVGSTITPSGSGLTGTAATFAGSGATLSQYQYADTTNDIYLYPEDVAAFNNGTAAFMEEVYRPSLGAYTGIAIASTTGLQKIFVGDTSDQYNVPSLTPTDPGLTVVHGMSESMDDEEFYAYRGVAVNQSTGTVYYSGETTSSSAPNCSGGTEQTGTIGALNPSTGTTKEIVLKGYVGSIRVDSAGNVWWLEDSGYCSLTGDLLASSYGIGELSAGGTVTETPFNSAGLSGINYPSDMSINAAGTTMYIADEGYSTITPVSLSGTPTSDGIVSLTNSKSPYSISTSTADGTTMWYSDNEPFDDYYYGWIPGSLSFATANLSEAAFADPYFFSYTTDYADGSFWIAGDEYGTGVGRVSGLSSTTSVNNYYPSPYNDDDGPEYYSVSAGGGYVWLADDEYQNHTFMQYGAPSAQGLITYNSKRRIGPNVSFPKITRRAPRSRSDHAHHR